MEHVTRENPEKSFLIYVVNFPRISLDYVMLCRQYNRDNINIGNVSTVLKYYQ